MGVLRGFRHLPDNLRDWGEWFARQQIESGLGNPDKDGWHLASDADGTRYWEPPAGFADDVQATKRWTIKTFDDDYSPVVGDDDNVLLVSTKATAVNVLLSQDIFEDGSQLTFYQYGAGQVTLVEGDNVDIRTPSGNFTLNEQYATVTLILAFSNDWIVAGRITA